jgi:signal transduction histidine kinase
MTEVLSHEMDSLSEESIARYLNIINEECDRLSGLISGLLDLQKLTAGKLEPDFKRVQLAEVVRQATDLFDGVAVKNRVDLSANISAPAEQTTIMGDRGQLMRILSNLLSNAIKYTNPSDTIRVGLSREDENVRLTVTDSGIGIPDDEKDKVFEKFYRIDNPTTRTKGGTGLGLAITQELVALHNGRIWVETGQNRGCSFHVLIPAAEASSE